MMINSIIKYIIVSIIISVMLHLISNGIKRKNKSTFIDNYKRFNNYSIPNSTAYNIIKRLLDNMRVDLEKDTDNDDYTTVAKLFYGILKFVIGDNGD